MIKLLIVDDSETEIQLLKHIFSFNKEISIVGIAKNGKECIHLVNTLKPDIITMDIQMPIMDGLEATKIIMSTHPTPIIVISSYLQSKEIDLTFRALEAGALSVLPKPTHISSPQFDTEMQTIISTVKNLSEIKVIKRRFPTKSGLSKHTSPSLIPSIPSANYEIIAIGSSVGGPQALKAILSKLPFNFPIPIIIVQHMTPGFIDGFVSWLNTNISLNAMVASNYQILTGGNVYFAPDHCHLQISRIDNTLMTHLHQSQPISGFCPSVTALFDSVARISKANAVGVLLTGMGTDGAEGLLAMRKAKSHTITQDKESAVVFGMAGVAAEMGAVDKVVALDQIAEYLLSLTSKQ